MVRFAAHRSDHAGPPGAAVLPAVGSLPFPPPAPHQGYLAALRIRGPSQRRPAAPELLLFAGPVDGEPQSPPQFSTRLTS